MKKTHWFYYICGIFSTASEDDFTLITTEVDCPECLGRLYRESPETLKKWKLRDKFYKPKTDKVERCL